MSEGGTLTEKRIDLGQIAFDAGALKQISNGDSIYTVSANSTAFFKIKYNSQDVDEAKRSNCKVKPSKDMLANKPQKGDLMIFVNYINPQTADKEVLRKKID